MSDTKSNLHPRNLHRSSYDFAALTEASPELANYVQRNAYGTDSINFSDPNAVKALNRALLKHFYAVEGWDVPEGYLCPPVPGRADYVHHLADLLAEANQGRIPKGKRITGLDVGTGANLIYPLLAHHSYGWNMVGSEIDTVAIASAEAILERNPAMQSAITLRIQTQPSDILRGIIQPGEMFDFTLCNPPFHASAQEAAETTQRKRSKLAYNQVSRGNANTIDAQPALNFGGQHNELWCDGGEVRFISDMIHESREFAGQCFWFTSLVSKKTSLPALYEALSEVGATEVKTIEMSQGQKISRFIAWTFFTPAQQKAWRMYRWNARG